MCRLRDVIATPREMVCNIYMCAAAAAAATGARGGATDYASCSPRSSQYPAAAMIDIARRRLRLAAPHTCSHCFACGLYWKYEYAVFCRSATFIWLYRRSPSVRYTCVHGGPRSAVVAIKLTHSTHSTCTCSGSSCAYALSPAKSFTEFIAFI